jgi:hypothetical protein
MSTITTITKRKGGESKSIADTKNIGRNSSGEDKNIGSSNR